MNVLDKFPIKLVKYLVSIGVEITVCTDKDSVPYLNFNTGMKSHLHLYYEHSNYVAHMRYDDKRALDYYADLHGAIRSCEHGRGFMSSSIQYFYEYGFNKASFDEWEKIQ